MLMESDTILEAEGLSKVYSRSQATTRKRLASILRRILLGRPFTSEVELEKSEFWAVKDVGFKLKRGEALGIIGFNGSGKTTLLRVLAGQLLPEEGEVRMVGRPAAMIDLTAGFQMSATGSQNIYLRSAMLGRSELETASSYEDIIDFAELGDAIDAPVSTYSSGMLMRLAFSIMVAIKPDVLFIDEILSVGDFRFRQKCLQKIRELRQTCAVVLVSHSMKDIELFCDQVIVLNAGHMVFEGEPTDAIKVLEEIKVPKLLSKDQKRSATLKPQFYNQEGIRDIKRQWTNEAGVATSEIGFGQTLYLNFSFTVTHTPKHLVIGVPVWTEEGTYVTGFSTLHQKKFKPRLEPGERFSLVLEIPKIGFNPGNYISNLCIQDGVEYLFRGENPVLTVVPTITNYWGAVSLPHIYRETDEIQETEPDETFWEQSYAGDLLETKQITEIKKAIDTRSKVFALVKEQGARIHIYEETLITVGYSEILKPGAHVIDVGAHHGSHTTSLANRVGDEGRVYAFEPNTHSMAVLKKRIEGRHNIEVLDIPVSDRKALVDFFQITGQYSSRSSLVDWTEVGTGVDDEGELTTVELQSDTLDNLFEDQPVDFIKCDCEGADLLVIEGARKIITKYQPLISIEFNEESVKSSGKNRQDFIDLTESLNYHMFSNYGALLDSENAAVYSSKFSDFFLVPQKMLSKFSDTVAPLLVAKSEGFTRELGKGLVREGYGYQKE